MVKSAVVTGAASGIGAACENALDRARNVGDPVGHQRRAARGRHRRRVGGEAVTRLEGPIDAVDPRRRHLVDGTTAGDH